TITSLVAPPNRSLLVMCCLSAIMPVGRNGQGKERKDWAILFGYLTSPGFQQRLTTSVTSNQDL
ncbi:MAG: hypothetical protein QXQ50_09490, partial [Candidatus Bathyarchaeia archaeon]